MAVSELIISHLCDKVTIASLEKTFRKKLPRRIVGEVATYTHSIKNILK
jgi:hypothetical protein